MERRKIINLSYDRVMELSTLRVFMTVANERSFSRAAEKLGRTQPAVSLALQRLELELGEKYNQQLLPNVLPPMLQVLVLSQSFNHSLEANLLPASLTYLKFGHSFNHRLVPGALPSRLSASHSQATNLFREIQGTGPRDSESLTEAA